MPIDSSQLPDANLVHSHSHSRLRRRWKAFRRRVSCIAFRDSLNHETARDKHRVFVSSARPLGILRRRWSALRALPRAFLKELGWVSSKIYLSWAFFVPFSENTPKNVASLAS